MAIDRVKKVWLVSPAAQAPTVPERLARVGLLHVSEVPQGEEGRESALTMLSADTRAVEAQIRRLTETLDILGEFSKTVKDLLSNLIATPIEATRKELDAALAAVDVEGLHQRVKELSARRAAAVAAAGKAKERLAAVKRFRALDVPVPAEGALRWSRATLWLAPEKQARRIGEPGLVPEGVVLEQLGVVGTKALVASVALRDQAEGVASRLRELGFEAVAAPVESLALGAHVAAIEEELRGHEQDVASAKAELAKLGKLRHQVELVLGHWEGKLEAARALGKMAATGRAVVMAGYVRAREEQGFREAVARDLPEVSVILEEPAVDDKVPVSLTNTRFFRPAQFLVEMFGLPGYQAFDPSAFLMASFVIFYGFCLGDAVYGVLQVALGWALARRYRAYPGLRNFSMLILYGGVAAFLVGVLTGTWASDLFKKEFGAQSLFGWAALDPLEKPLVALGIALMLGLANQFWGVTMRMYGEWRGGERWGAICDGGFWLLLLPGLVLLIAAFFSPTLPPWVSRVGSWLALFGATGLVLTQGRKEKTLVGKVVVGFVSLYGIVGTYGCVSFIGDTLSYSRLLALGLTTTIVGMAVNIIANLLHFDVVILGTVVFVGFLIVGHVFNLLLSGLGAFIHSARLIFVEFFGRFYEPGAQRFRPLGATSSRIRITG